MFREIVILAHLEADHSSDSDSDTKSHVPMSFFVLLREIDCDDVFTIQLGLIITTLIYVVFSM